MSNDTTPTDAATSVWEDLLCSGMVSFNSNCGKTPKEAASLVAALIRTHGVLVPYLTVYSTVKAMRDAIYDIDGEEITVETGQRLEDAIASLTPQAGDLKCAICGHIPDPSDAVDDLLGCPSCGRMTCTKACADPESGHCATCLTAEADLQANHIASAAIRSSHAAARVETPAMDPELLLLLRNLCGDYGDNDWPDTLHPADVLEKHLMHHMVGIHDELVDILGRYNRSDTGNCYCEEGIVCQYCTSTALLARCKPSRQAPESESVKEDQK